MRVTKTNGGSGGGGSGQVFILVDGVLTPIAIDKADPSNSVALPTQEFGRISESDFNDCSITPIAATPVSIIVSTAYAQGIEVINTSGFPMLITASSGEEFIISGNGVTRQAMAFVAGTTLSANCIQATASADSGIVAINLFN